MIFWNSNYGIRVKGALDTMVAHYLSIRTTHGMDYMAKLSNYKTIHR